MDDVVLLVESLQKYNEAYRNGSPLISDHEYDTLVEKLKMLDPYHPFLHTVEPEKFAKKKEVRHPVPMLSTEKAYRKEDVERFVSRVKKAATEIGIRYIRFRVTPKLDGLAGRDDGSVFTTRGNGETGYEINNAFDKGIYPVGGRGQGIGEIVILESYFQEHLAESFEHPRNMVVGIIASDTLNELAKEALQDEAVHFVPYNMLPFWEGSAEELISNIDAIAANLTRETDYPTDGVVAEAMEEDVKRYMGATSHHYRWQIAVKTKGETALTKVTGIQWQVGRTGNVTPVLEVQPVSLSGATIRRVTAHHAGIVREKRIGIGAEVEIIRSGEVIPKLEKVIAPAEQFGVPKNCPDCGRELRWNNDFLRCLNPLCRAKVEQKISHWFKTLGTADWFGIKTIQRLVANGYDTLQKIYRMKKEDFLLIGFGPVQAENLVDAIHTSKRKPVEEWRFLAAFGIPSLGKGDSRKLLLHMKLEDVVRATAEDIEKIHGFGEITSRSIADGVKKEKSVIKNMLALGFNLEKTRRADEVAGRNNAISGKGVVFTGKMTRGDRESLQAEARRLGANVQNTVNRNTSYLICGEKPGVGKLKKAEQEGVRIISESEYHDMIEPLADGR